MSKERFVAVAEAFGAKIHAPSDGSIAFCNSPYPPHRESSAVDIYPADAKFEDEVSSPVNGVVKETRKFSSPNLYPDKTPLCEYLILIESADNPDVYVKIIHAHPKVKKGERVKVGDTLASLVRSGYWGFSVDPHIHVELRNPKDPIRALGSYSLQVLNAPEKKSETKNTPENGVLGVVVKAEKRYAIIRPNPENWITIGNFSGLAANVGNTLGILDGGLPFMGYGGIVTAKNDLPIGTPIHLHGITIGKITKNLTGLSKIEAIPFRVNAGSCTEELGISMKIHLGYKQEIKLVPAKASQLNVKVNDIVTIKNEKNK